MKDPRDAHSVQWERRWGQEFMVATFSKSGNVLMESRPEDGLVPMSVMFLQWYCSRDQSCGSVSHRSVNNAGQKPTNGQQPSTPYELY